MRLIVMFDLPTQTSADRRNYRHFRKFLIKNGYSMMQFSLYSNIGLNRSDLNYQVKLFTDDAPPVGYVAVLVVTESQYANINLLVVEQKRSIQEQTTMRFVVL